MYRSSFSIRRLAAVLTTLAGFCCTLTAGPEDLIINEIQVANIDMFIDPSFNYGGWIEFYNPTEEILSLYGLYITDDPTSPTKFKFPVGMGSIAPGGFKTVWFDHYAPSTDNRYSSVSYRQVEFKLTHEGGTIYIFDSDQQLIISQDYPPAVTRCSYARTSDGGSDWSYCSTPTPAASNDGSSFAAAQLPPPTADHESTVYTSPFTLHVSIPAGATLYYTTDGSTPTSATSEQNSTGTFRIQDQTTVLRLRLFQDGFLPSPVVTRTYIYKDRDYYLPIVSVVTDAKNLYDNRIGVYVDGTNGITANNKANSNKNRAWERPVNFEYLIPDADGNYSRCVINQETDFEVCGGWSRHYAPSSFRLKAAKQYEGQNFLPYAFFPTQKPYIKNKALQIRNGGNDYNSRIMDAAIQQCILSSGVYIDGEAVQPAHVFFNGKFQYTYNVREPSNKNLSYSNYGLDKDEVDEFEINGASGYVQKSGTDTAFRQWMNLAKTLGGKLDDDKTYAHICELVDIDEYCNYMAAECYIGSSDWLTNSNNVKGFRSKADGGRFHLVMLDLDAGFSWTDMISRLPGHLNDSRYNTGHNFLIEIFLNMLKYEPFKKKFIDAYCLVDGSIFAPQRCADIITAMANLTTNALAWEGKSPWGSANSLINNISSSNNRSARINSLRSYFNLGTGYPVRLSSNLQGVSLRVNRQEVPTGSFDGTLFGDVLIEAGTAAGYRFKGWVSDGSVAPQETIIPLAADWKYYDKGSLDGKNWSARYFSATGWKSGPGPFGYGTVGMKAAEADYKTTLDYGTDANHKRPTYYFRYSFTLGTVPADDIFQLTYYVDDGCVIYLNGTEVARYHMPDGTTSYNQYSTAYEGSQAYAATLTLDNALLRTGVNVIAVEVHNTSATSSDIYWGAQLTRCSHATVGTTPQLQLADVAVPGRFISLIAQFEALSPEERSSAVSTPIRINEVSAGNTVYINDHFKKNDWIELYNATDSDLDAAGLYLTDKLHSPQKYQIPTSSPLNTVIPARGHLILWADALEDISQLHTGFKLGNNDEELVLLTSSEEFVLRNQPFFRQHPELADFADILTYPAHHGDQSVGRYPDGANTFYLMHRPTIGHPNSLHTYDSETGTDQGIDTGIYTPPQPGQPASAASQTPARIFDLNGRFVGTGLAALRPGIYLVRKPDGTSHKAIIK